MIVLLGGAGFLGRHLRALLLAEGVAFTIVSPRLPPDLVPPRGRERFLSADDFAGPAGAALLAGAAALVNLAGRSVPGTHAAAPWREIEDKLAADARLFARCAAANPALRLVQISSGGTVYGDAGPHPAAEDAPCAPISGYGLANLLSEQALAFTARTTGLSHRILRLSNPVGRFQTSQAQGIVSIALRAARDGTAFTLFGDGSQVRDYVAADDVAAAILAACRDGAHPGATWNAGSGTGHTVLDVLALAERVSGRPVCLDRRPPRAIDVPRIVLDCARIRRDLGWRARVGLPEAMGEIWRGLAG